MRALRDFVLGEWRTFVGLAALGAVVLALLWYEASDAPPSPPPTLVAGVQLGPARMGQDAAAVRAALGPPAATARLTPGVEAWRYPRRGLELHLRDGRVIAARAVVSRPDPPVDPEAYEAGLLLPDAVPYEGALTFGPASAALPRSQPRLDALLGEALVVSPKHHGAWWRRYKDLIAVFTADAQGAPRLREVIIVAPLGSAAPLAQTEAAP